MLEEVRKNTIKPFSSDSHTIQFMHHGRAPNQTKSQALRKVTANAVPVAMQRDIQNIANMSGKEEGRVRDPSKDVQLPTNKNTVRSMIDSMCQKEKKYVRQYMKEDFVNKNDFIFEINKCHNLKRNKKPPAIQEGQNGLEKSSSKDIILVNGFQL